MNIWENEEDKKDWEKYGLKCAIRRNSITGVLCGYVGVNKKHSFYKKGYNDLVPTFGRMKRNTSIDNIGIINAVCGEYDETVDKAIMALILDAHGGITYASQGNDTYLPKNNWWIGFDCGHLYDKLPFMPIGVDNDIYRDMEYVTNEVNNLAKQLYNIG